MHFMTQQSPFEDIDPIETQEWLESVDSVVIFDEDEPKDLIAAILPQVLVKGRDWEHYVSGREVVEANGGHVVLADMVEGCSTSGTIERVLKAYGSKNSLQK